MTIPEAGRQLLMLKQERLSVLKTLPYIIDIKMKPLNLLRRKQSSSIKQLVLKLQAPVMYMTRIRCQEQDQHMEAVM